jgi:thioredoxin-like negative regulator of GroEL
MAKQKKKSVQLATSGFGVKTIAPKQLDAKLRRAADFAEAENWQGALGILVPLSHQYPDNQKIWGFLSDASFENGDMQLYQKPVNVSSRSPLVATMPTPWAVPTSTICIR